MNTFFLSRTPITSIPSITLPIIMAISPLLRNCGNVVTNRWIIEAAAKVAREVWNRNEFNQVRPSAMGWIDMKGRD